MLNSVISENFVIDVLKCVDERGIPNACSMFGVTTEQVARWKLRYYAVSAEQLRPFSWIQVCLETHIEWPTSEMRISFEGQEFLLRPATPAARPDIVAEYDPYIIDHDQVHARARRFMSVLSWLRKRMIREAVVGRTTYEPMRVGPAPSIQNCTEAFELRFVPQLDERSSFALALYREALNANLISFRFLGYWKLLSLLFRDGIPAQKRWLESTLNQCVSPNSLDRLDILRAVFTDDTEIVNHLYKSRRCEVAHATGMEINPDDPIALDAVDADVPLMKEIAEILIERELNVQSEAALYMSAGLEPPNPSNRSQMLACDRWLLLEQL